jgi:multidrug transporter EmrE-like cation transporter
MGQSLILILLAGVNSCIGNVLLKMSRVRLPEGAGVLDQFLSPYFVAGMFFYGVNVALFAKALDRIPVAIGYPVLATSGFALLAIVSYFVFGERMSMLQILGLFLAIFSIVLLAYGQTQ